MEGFMGLSMIKRAENIPSGSGLVLMNLRVQLIAILMGWMMGQKTYKNWRIRSMADQS
jgi:hypothetical protein